MTTKKGLDAYVRPAEEKLRKTIADEVGKKRINREGIRGVTLRLTPEQHKRVVEFALDQSVRIQDLAVLGISRLMQENGLKPL